MPRIKKNYAEAAEAINLCTVPQGFSSKCTNVIDNLILHLALGLSLKESFSNSSTNTLSYGPQLHDEHTFIFRYFGQKDKADKVYAYLKKHCPSTQIDNRVGIYSEEDTFLYSVSTDEVFSHLAPILKKSLAQFAKHHPDIVKQARDQSLRHPDLFKQQFREDNLMNIKGNPFGEIMNEINYNLILHSLSPLFGLAGDGMLSMAGIKPNYSDLKAETTEEIQTYMKKYDSDLNTTCRIKPYSPEGTTVELIFNVACQEDYLKIKRLLDQHQHPLNFNDLPSAPFRLNVRITTENFYHHWMPDLRAELQKMALVGEGIKNYKTLSKFDPDVTGIHFRHKEWKQFDLNFHAKPSEPHGSHRTRIGHALHHFFTHSKHKKQPVTQNKKLPRPNCP